MATEDGAAPDTIERELKEGAHRLDFFQAVRRLECALAGKSRVGASVHPNQDGVRFCQDPSLAFAPAAMAGYVPAGKDHPARLFVNFMGLTGPNGALPLHVTEYLHDRVLNNGDTAMARFLDVFNHRMISFFYRAWASGEQVLSRDRPDDDTFDRYVGSLLGIGMDSFRNADSVPDEAKLHYAAHLGGQTRNADGLEAILSGYFGVPARAIEFVGRWMPIADEYRYRLGLSPESQRLGTSVVLGRHVWDCQLKFRIRLGPMALSDYERLLPRGQSFSRLVDWVRNYVGEDFVWDVVLVLGAAEVPRARLGSYGRLGWTTWLASRPFQRDADDLVVGESAIEAVTGRKDRGSGNG